MLKAVKIVAFPASLGFVALRVHAESESKTLPNAVLKVEELSLYSSPHREAKFVEEKQTQLQEGISWIRQSVAPYTSWFQDVYTKTRPKVETAVTHSKGTYEYLRNAPPEFYPRLGLIGFAGIVGLFLARGSRIKKIIYPLGFMGIGASLYYPQQAATIAKDTGTVVYDWSLQGLVALESLWKDGGKKKSGKKEKPAISDPSVSNVQTSAEVTTLPESSSEISN